MYGIYEASVFSTRHARPARCAHHMHQNRDRCRRVDSKEGRVPSQLRNATPAYTSGSSPTVQGPDAAARTARGSRLRQEPRDGGIVFDVMEERFIVMRDSCFFSSEDMPACNDCRRFDLGDFFAGTLRSRICRHRRFFHRARRRACLPRNIWVGFGRFALLPLPVPRYCI
jgi:hypothetical protein